MNYGQAVHKGRLISLLVLFSPAAFGAETGLTASSFGALDFTVLTVYLAAMVAVGLYFTFSNRNTDDFFRGGKRVHWIPAGLSIFATMLSSITFIAIPAKAYMTDWTFVLVNMTVLLVTPVVVGLFLPFYRRIDATSAYEYLEKRFHYSARAFAAASFVIFQVARMAIVMYLPALMLARITQMSEEQCILLMGVLSIVYCTLGGLPAVIWTDAIQSVVLLGGALVCLGLITVAVGGPGTLIQTALADDKLRLINNDWSGASYASAALWVVLVGGIGQSLVPYASDQALVQRYISTPSQAQAAKAIWTNAIIVVPATLVFFSLGTGLYVFYKMFPNRLDSGFPNDAIFPLFISRELPVGLAGLLVAGIFAAAQSTISTSMNSSVTVIIIDFVRRFRKTGSDASYLWLARALTVLLGTLGTASALVLAQFESLSMWDTFMALLGLLGGPMCGLFCLGMFSRRGNWKGAMVGATAGIVALYWVQRHTHTYFLLYGTIGVSVSWIVGYATSLLLPVRQKDMAGLTVHTLAD